MDVVKRKVYELVYLRLEKEGLEMFLKSVLFSLFEKIVNKFVASDELMKNKIDICLISETKVDESFPNQQFKINGCKMFRKGVLLKPPTTFHLPTDPPTIYPPPHRPPSSTYVKTED